MSDLVRLTCEGKYVLVFSQPHTLYGMAQKEAESVGDQFLFWLKRPFIVTRTQLRRSQFDYARDNLPGSPSLAEVFDLNANQELWLQAQPAGGDMVCLAKEFVIEPNVGAITAP